MNPYWTNPAPDTDEWLHSEAVKKKFFMYAVGHIILWIVSLGGIIFLYLNAQKTAPIQAFTAKGEPAWGTPLPIGSGDTAVKQEEFLNLHVKDVITHLFMRTEKGMIPELQHYTYPYLLATIEQNFGFTGKRKGGYSQTLFIQEFEKLLTKDTRLVYRVHGVLSSHSLEGSANTPIYLIVAIDKKESSFNNPLGWVVSVIISVDAKDFYNKERQALIDEVTHTKTDSSDTKNSPKKTTP